jgi:molecular chaperone GrpE
VAEGKETEEFRRRNRGIGKYSEGVHRIVRGRESLQTACEGQLIISKRGTVATHVKEQNQNLLPPADLLGEIERLQECLRIERDRNLRALADFKNYRRRVERDGSKLAEEGKRGIILPLLDIIDDVEKAMQWASDAERPLVKRVRIIHKKLLALLETHGVFPFESVGTPFNSNLHEAVAMAKHEGSEPGIVVDELRRGYLWNNQLLRAAQVRVAG